MRIYSQLTKKQYLTEMRRQLGSFSSWGDERYTAIILGSFFWVTYHSGYEWNRRITNEKNRALGFVRDSYGGCTVHCFCTRGYLDIVSGLAMFAISFGLCWFLTWFMSLSDPVLNEMLLFLPLIESVFATLVTAVTSFVHTGMTERGCWGRLMLLALLHHPEDPENNIEEY